MKKEEKYEDLRQFFLNNFETTANDKDRLHTQDIFKIVLDNNKFYFGNNKIAEIFRNLNIGEHRRSCNINRKIKTGYYFLIYKGNSQKMI
jgi:hypothetical protein